MLELAVASVLWTVRCPARRNPVQNPTVIQIALAQLEDSHKQLSNAQSPSHNTEET